MGGGLPPFMSIQFTGQTGALTSTYHAFPVFGTPVEPLVSTKECAFQRIGGWRSADLLPHPTISLPEKNWAISCAAVSGASEPCTEFSPIDLACTLRMVPGAAFAGSVAPMISRYLATAFSPSSTCTTTGPEVMNSTSSPKNGRALCTA